MYMIQELGWVNEAYKTIEITSLSADCWNSGLEAPFVEVLKDAATKID